MSIRNNTNAQEHSKARVRMNNTSHTNRGRAGLVISAALVLALGAGCGIFASMSAAESQQTPATVQTQVVQRRASEVVKAGQKTETSQVEQGQPQQTRETMQTQIAAVQDNETPLAQQAQQATQAEQTTEPGQAEAPQASEKPAYISEDDACTTAIKTVSWCLPNEAHVKLHNDGDTPYYTAALSYEGETKVVAVDASSGMVISVVDEGVSTEATVEELDATFEGEVA